MYMYMYNYMYVPHIAQFRNCAAHLPNCAIIYKLHKKIINSARHIAQFVNSDLGLVPQPRSLAAVTQLDWKLRYFSVTVIQCSLRFLSAAHARRYYGI